ncbi:MAG: DUF835 domain-containing protein [Thermoplasmata archaeon]|nr:DUF835 domain-containing protein [Thermoplasmata archaeon]
MEFNPYAVPPILSMVIHIFLLIYLLAYTKSRHIKKAFVPLFLTVAVWAGAESVMRWFVVTEENYRTLWCYPYALLMARIMALAVLAIALAGAYISFMYPLPRITKRQEKMLIYTFIFSFLIYMPIVLFSGAMVEDVLYYWAGYGTDFGDLLLYILPIMAVFVVVVFYNFSSSYIHAKTKIEKKQIQLVAIGAAMFVFPGFITGMLPQYMPNKQFIVPGVPAGNFYIIFLDIFLLYGAAKYRLFTVEAVVENGVKEMRLPETAKEIEPGDVVLVISPDGKKGFETFRYLASKMPGLCLTTKHPKTVRTEFQFSKLPVIWVSEITTKENAVEPMKLEFELSYHIYAFLREAENRVVYIDDMDYIVAINGFKNTHEFLKSVADEAASRNSVLIFSLSMSPYEPDQQSSIRSIASKEVVQEEMHARRPRNEFSVKEGNAILVEAFSEQREEIKSKISGYKVLGVSAHFPKKFKKGFPEGTEVDCVWITDTSGYEKAISSRRMEFEAIQEIISFVKSNGDRALVYIDAIPAFIITNEFLSILKFIKDIVDIVHEYNAKVVFEIPPELFKPSQKALVERRMDVVYFLDKSTLTTPSLR